MNVERTSTRAESPAICPVSPQSSSTLAGERAAVRLTAGRERTAAGSLHAGSMGISGGRSHVEGEGASMVHQLTVARRMRTTSNSGLQGRAPRGSSAARTAATARSSPLRCRAARCAAATSWEPTAWSPFRRARPRRPGCRERPRSRALVHRRPDRDDQEDAADRQDEEQQREPPRRELLRARVMRLRPAARALRAVGAVDRAGIDGGPLRSGRLASRGRHDAGV